MSLDAFLRKRGYDPANTLGMLRRMFVDCWAEPTFRDFWRVWNPLYGYALFQLYRALGGNRRPVFASFVVFAACGFVLHDLLVFAMTRRFTIATTAAFIAFWAMLLVEGRSSPPPDATRARNVLANVGRVVLGLALGVGADRALHGAAKLVAGG